MERIKNIQWGKHIKRGIIGAVILGIVGVAGTGVFISQAKNQRAKVEAANSKIIESKAKELKKTLITEEQVKQKVSDTIGVSKKQIEFNKVVLYDGKDNYYDNHGFHRDRNSNDHYLDDLDDRIEDRIKEELYDKIGAIDMLIDVNIAEAANEEPLQNQADTNQDEAKQAEQPATVEPSVDFSPKYLVKCTADRVRYVLVLDAETGEVISSKAR